MITNVKTGLATASSRTVAPSPLAPLSGEHAAQKAEANGLHELGYEPDHPHEEHRERHRGRPGPAVVGYAY
jgi:hypothetical protein